MVTLRFCALKYILIACCFLYSLSLLANPINPTPVIIAINDAPPYRIVTDTGVSGFYVEVIEAIGKELDWEIKYRVVPFRRALKMVEEGDADLMLGPVRKPERELYMDYSVPAFPAERRLFFYKEAANKIFKYDDLKGKKIGVLRGSVYFEPFDSDVDLQKEAGTNYENLLNMLNRGHLHTVIIPELLSVKLIQKLKIDVNASPFFVPGETSYIGISKKSRILSQIDDIKLCLKKLKSSPQYEDILLKYLARKSN